MALSMHPMLHDGNCELRGVNVVQLLLLAAFTAMVAIQQKRKFKNTEGYFAITTKGLLICELIRNL